MNSIINISKFLGSSNSRNWVWSSLSDQKHVTSSNKPFIIICVNPPQICRHHLEIFLLEKSIENPLLIFLSENEMCCLLTKSTISLSTFWVFTPDTCISLASFIRDCKTNCITCTQMNGVDDSMIHEIASLLSANEGRVKRETRREDERKFSEFFRVNVILGYYSPSLMDLIHFICKCKNAWCTRDFYSRISLACSTSSGTDDKVCSERVHSYDERTTLCVLNVHLSCAYQEQQPHSHKMKLTSILSCIFRFWYLRVYCTEMTRRNGARKFEIKQVQCSSRWCRWLQPTVGWWVEFGINLLLHARNSDDITARRTRFACNASSDASTEHFLSQKTRRRRRTSSILQMRKFFIFFDANAMGFERIETMTAPKWRRTFRNAFHLFGNSKFSVHSALCLRSIRLSKLVSSIVSEREMCALRPKQMRICWRFWVCD